MIRLAPGRRGKAVAWGLRARPHAFRRRKAPFLLTIGGGCGKRVCAVRRRRTLLKHLSFRPGNSALRTRADAFLMASPRRLFVRLSFGALLLSGAGVSGSAQTAPLPASYDLRNLDGRSYLGPVRNQGDAGTCYAFSAIAAAESTYNRATGRYDDAVANFAESFIAWSLDPKYEGIMGNEGSNQRFDELQGLVDFGVPRRRRSPMSRPTPACRAITGMHRG